MADQGRWFKLWVSSRSDPSLSVLPIADFGRWCKLGVYTKEHGTDGAVSLIQPTETDVVHPLQTDFQVASFDAVLRAITRFPNITIASVSSETSMCVSFLVEWRNWPKYQGDFSTPRVKAFREKNAQVKRSKKRGEEKRGDEKRREKELQALGPVVWPPELQDVKTRLDSLQVSPDLYDPDYWRKIDAWVEGTRLPVFYLDELKAYLAHQASVNGRRRHKDQKAGFRNWLATALRWKERDAQRAAQSKRS